MKIKPLFVNYSRMTITKDQGDYMNLGLNFSEIPPTVNRSEVEGACARYQRSMFWPWYWHWELNIRDRDNRLDVIEEEESEEEVEESKISANIFTDKTIKTNLPPRKCPIPAALSSHTQAVRHEIIGANLNQKEHNMPPRVRAAGKDLVTIQRERVVKITRTDKTGGWAILDFDDYVDEMESKLRETYDDKGVVKLKYERIDEKELKNQWKKIVEIIDEGEEKGYITPEDAKIM